MNRKQLLNKAFQRGHLLTLENKIYLNRVKDLLDGMLKEDLGKEGDITANSVLRKNFEVKAIIKAKQNGIIAGLEEAEYFYKKNKIKVKKLKKDGSKIKKSDVILILIGKEKDLLKTERTGLNLLQRMSGIATSTDSLQSKAKKMLVVATRKTHWGLLDNKAVFIGGGSTHRLGLHESILIKENHLESLKKEGVKDYISIVLNRAWKNKNKAVFIEIEVKNKNEAIKAGKKFKELNKNKKKPSIIMLDNFKPLEIKKTIKKLKKLKLYDYVLLEASGGVNPDNIKEFEKTGVDVASLGFLTHSPKALDISQEIV